LQNRLVRAFCHDLCATSRRHPGPVAIFAAEPAARPCPSPHAFSVPRCADSPSGACRLSIHCGNFALQASGQIKSGARLS
jgi:hypothetical protein